jgi:hypothetical protein
MKRVLQTIQRSQHQNRVLKNRVLHWCGCAMLAAAQGLAGSSSIAKLQAREQLQFAAH